jgi:hypothetical protein
MTAKPTHQQLVTRANAWMDRAYGEDDGPSMPFPPEADIIGVLQPVILESKFSNLSNEEVLSWLPSEVLEEVITWLEEIITEAEREA